ncbi:MAG: PAS domain-containing protein, partial [Deltaproteobacteria bacterium]|nr:PAS domain-containing protein [Deltaproteobacteria bacterium]
MTGARAGGSKKKVFKDTMLSVESILEGSPIPIFVIDRNHRIILWNRACEELTGFRVGEMIGTDGQYRP